MFKRKFVRQENLKDCGAACLLMIIRHYGGNYPLEKLRQMMKMDKSGISAYNLIETAKKIGFDARGYKSVDLKNIKENSIVHLVINKTYHHFVVVDKVDYKKEIITILDPSFGYRKYTFKYFESIWSNIIITLYPIRKIAKISTFKNTKQTFKKIIKPYKKSFTLIFFLSVIYTILNMLNTFYLKTIIDDLSISLSFQVYLFIIFTVLFSIKIIINFVRNNEIIKLDYNISKKMMTDTFRHLLSLPLNYFDSRVTGDLVSRIDDLSYVKEIIIKSVSFLLVDILLIFSSIIMILFLSSKLLIIILLIIIIYISIILCFKKTIKLYAITNQEKQAMYSSKIIESLKGIHTIKNLNIEKEIYDDVILKYNDLIDNDFKFNKRYNLVAILKEYIIGGGIILIVFLGGLFIKQGIINISDLVISIFLFNIFTDSIRNLFDLEQLFRLSSNALIRISEFYDIEEENFYYMEMKRNNIIFDNVSFSYNGLNKIIDKLNININDNDKVMITGPSGCGKSTIAKLIIGEYKSDDGRIILGNNDILSYSKKTIRDNTCYISQDEIIFTDSIYNNIKLKRAIVEEELFKIMDITCIDEIFKKRNLDCHMLIEEDATNLSGGERNRIILARTLLKNSKVIIIDEGTSQMNVKLERHILKNIFEHFKDRTIIVITHRMDNSDLFNNIITLDERKKMEVLM